MTEIDRLVPHRPPMQLIRRVVEHDGDSLVAEVIVDDDAFHRGPHGVPAWMGIEYLGQSAAAWFGIHGRANDTVPRAGLLVSCREYSARDGYFPRGAVLEVRVRIRAAPRSPLVAIAGVISSSGAQADDLLAEGRLAVYLTDGP